MVIALTSKPMPNEGHTYSSGACPALCLFGDALTSSLSKPTMIFLCFWVIALNRAPANEETQALHKRS